VHDHFLGIYDSSHVSVKVVPDELLDLRDPCGTARENDLGI
jgi:hypothetical protein